MICDWCGGTGVEWTADKRPTKAACRHCAGTGRDLPPEPQQIPWEPS